GIDLAMVRDATWMVYRAPLEGDVMRSIRLFALIAAAGCGDCSAAPPDGHVNPHPDSPVADMMMIDEPMAGPATNLPNLTPPATGTLHVDFGSQLAFSPDGSKVGAIANFQGARNDSYIVAVDGTGFHRMQDATACGTCDVSVIQWTADGTAAYVTGDLVANADTAVLKLDPA